VLAAAGHFPTVVFRSPFDKVGHLGAYGVLAFLAVSFFGHALAAALRFDERGAR
jgi:hypothetical protein